jgi:hypothetical protein
MLIKKLPVMAVSVFLGLVACGDDNGVIAPSGSGAVSPGGGISSSSDFIQNSGTFSSGGITSVDDENDLDDARVMDGTEILLKVAGTTATVENNNGCVTVENQSATITCPGAYYVTGESSDFQVVVNTPAVENEANTGIYLYNAILKSSNSPILVKNAGKAVLHLVKGTTNVVEDGKGDHLFTTVNGKQDTAKAAIYSKDDMNIKGAGKLTVTGNFKNGIQSSNDLKIKNGNITVVAEDNGIKGKGSLEVSGGTLNITAKAGDGLESDECEKDALDSCINIVEGKGIVNISGGAITIVSGDDGIQAANYITVSDSTAPSSINIKSTGKGFMAEKTINVNGGTTVVDADDDAMHTHWSIFLNAGNVTVSSKDDGLHADSALYMRGSTINVVTASEGIEAYKIFAEGGVSATFATDDGWNGAGGPKDPNATGMLSMLSGTGGYIVISGGYHYISAKGSMIDVLDANGTATMTGGVLILEITGQSYEAGMDMGGGEFPGGGDFPGGDFPGGDFPGGDFPGGDFPGGGFNFGDSSFNFGDFPGGGFPGGDFNFGDSTFNFGDFQGGDFPGGGMGMGGGGCSTNIPGGLIDTDNGFTITGGVLLAFGDYTTDVPDCATVSYTSDNYYGSEKAAFKPTYQGSTILYGGEVKSVGQVETAGMTEFKFPNGVSYMYK